MTRESQTIEWKESWRDDYLRWVCAFANAQGGVLVIGRNDQGEAVGVVGGSKLLEDLPNKIRDLFMAKQSGNGLVEGLAESQQKILQMVKSDPHISKKTMAEIIGISTTAIDKNIKKLKTLKLLKRVGSPKGGHWEILK